MDERRSDAPFHPFCDTDGFPHDAPADQPCATRRHVNAHEGIGLDHTVAR
jgi:hypothetical protein